MGCSDSRYKDGIISHPGGLYDDNYEAQNYSAHDGDEEEGESSDTFANSSSSSLHDEDTFPPVEPFEEREQLVEEEGDDDDTTIVFHHHHEEDAQQQPKKQQPQRQQQELHIPADETTQGKKRVRNVNVHQDIVNKKILDDTKKQAAAVVVASASSAASVYKKKREVSKKNPTIREKNNCYIDGKDSNNRGDKMAMQEAASPSPPTKHTTSTMQGIFRSMGRVAGGKWSEPIASSYMVRSANYMKKKKKIESGKMLFRLVHTEIVKSRKGCISSASQTPGTWYSNHKELIPGDSFLLVLNLQLRSLATNVISYHLMDDDHHAKELKSGNPSARLLRKLLSPDTRDVWRDSRIKMIPRIIEAPFVVRMAVSSRPVIIGRKVSCKYHMSGKYAEIKCNLDSSSVAAAAIKLAHKWSTKIVCELVWLLEGQNIKELPEQLLAGLDRIAFNLVSK